MKRAAFALLFLLAGVSAAARCVTQTFIEPPREFRAAADTARTAICTRLLAITPGAQIAIARNGRIVWSAGFGYADVEHQRPVAETTMFRVGSISKPLTADAFALLVQQGKLDPDAPVRTYVPSFPQKAWPVTARQLAGHLSGIRGYEGDEYRSTRHYESVAEGLRIFADDPLEFEPGTRYLYTPYGYALLSAALEGASGKDFPTLVEEDVIEPLHLAHTALDMPSRDIPERAHPYDRDSKAETFSPSPPVDNSNKWAAGGFLSTAEDLVRFGSAHLAPGRLTRQSLDLLLTTMKTADGKETHYGAGWEITPDAAGRRIAGHRGSAMGGSAVFRVDRDSGVVAALCMNVSIDKQVYETATAVWDEITALFDEVHR